MLQQQMPAKPSGLISAGATVDIRLLQGCLAGAKRYLPTGGMIWSYTLQRSHNFLPQKKIMWAGGIFLALLPADMPLERRALSERAAHLFEVRKPQMGGKLQEL